MIVYISGPYTHGDPAENVKRAIDVADQIANAGHTVFIPHLTHYWHEQRPHSWEFWMRQDLEMLMRCDVLVRIPGESRGADIEEQEAKSANIPVIMWDYPENVKYTLGTMRIGEPILLATPCEGVTYRRA